MTEPSHIKEITIKPVKNIDDKGVLAQLDESILECLGAEVLETGFDLRSNRRDMFFAHGSVQYQPYNKTAKVILNTKQ